MFGPRISLRRKIFLIFTVFFVLGGALWYLNYHKHSILTQKLRILEKKDRLFNTILEARRYEKNYFLFLDYQNLSDAISYAEQGENAFEDLIANYGAFALSKNLEEELERLREYKQALWVLRGYYHNGALETNQQLIDDLAKRHRQIRSLGSRITGDMEEMLREERRYVNRLMKESRLYHFISLAGILLLSVFTALFLVLNVNRPLKAIENAIKKISVGDYENIPELSAGAEFESLVESLNNMIRELNRRSEQLIQTKKLASLGTLTSGVAHELNNPLNNISTSVQILLEELEEGDREYHRLLLEETEGQVQRARDIVRALLEFSRERSFSLQPVKFKDLVSETIKLIKGEVPSNVELRVNIPDGIEAWMDPRRIQQVLLNLILNGVQAMDKGGTLEILAREKEEQGGFCFQVADQGRGIPQENLHKIFDPFFTTKDVGQGSGLGLSVSHGIVEQHGGRIEVESEVGRGTKFKVFLPKKGEPMNDSRPAAAHRPAS
ncbi:MAG: HAMP domain-containing protein [Deltaproteobacteria bacterium]|nr:HAMP domain-containing protein [Deltaproteobacteria bacterium]MBW1922541.1 HAMP domain-containing protein [Deltaproteobacteria bacterium]MBW1948398.1 HAMP domain-containing protein [Deltaproteobacteria bacterium]MBW2007093.1 HAMP domain-containing protein [Deltaproteobacteria bacterium]MBW2346586.1 HAMP domain-containing protein [Deltaproteobacteria bacterium]